MPESTSFITGAGGFLGHRLAEALSQGGRQVHGLLLPGESNRHLDRSVTADIRDYDAMKESITPETSEIYHLAAIASVPASVEDPRSDFETNALGTLNMLELARGLPLRAFVLTSTVSVLRPDNPTPLGEDAVYGPSSPYGASKMASEAYCTAYHHCYGVPIRIVRLFNVYGPGRRSLVIYDLVKKLLADPTVLPILGEGFQVRDFLYVEDAVDGIVLTVDKGLPGEIYHVGSGQPVSIRALAEILIQLIGTEDACIRSSGATWVGDMPQWYADVSKIKELGFCPKVELIDGIQRTIAWARATGS